ncbi:MAG: hypothetical protein ACI4TH_05280 [Candidatus Ornithomonoglobus sp.]
MLIDLTGDTVAADKLLYGYTAHDKSGNPVTGNVTFASVYTGSGEPSESLGSDGDFYFVVDPSQISFTINDGGSEAETFSVASGTTWAEWIGTGRLIFNDSLVLYIYGGVVATEAGVYALSLDGSTAVNGSDEIISGATYTIINWAG